MMMMSPLQPPLRKAFVITIIVVSLALITKSCAALQIQFRSATEKDVFVARKTMFQQAMNPLSISQERLLVAYNNNNNDDDDDGDDDDDDKNSKQEQFLGFGQIRPLSNNNNNNNNKDSDSSGFNVFELASLYVFPEHRRQGVGGALVDELLQRFDRDHTPALPTKTATTTTRKTPLSDSNGRNNIMVCLLTLRPTVPFFQAHGFSVADDKERAQLPLALQLEYAAGSILSAFLKNDLVCMIRR